MNLKAMSIDKLSKLKEQVDATISSRVIEERRTLQNELGKLDRLAGVDRVPRLFDLAYVAPSPRSTAIRQIRPKRGPDAG
jgi:hypothetical protein